MYLPQVLQVYWLTFTVYINICARTNNGNKNTAKSTMKYISAANDTTTFTIQLPYYIVWFYNLSWELSWTVFPLLTTLQLLLQVYCLILCVFNSTQSLLYVCTHYQNTIFFMSQSVIWKHNDYFLNTMTRFLLHNSNVFETKCSQISPVGRL